VYNPQKILPMLLRVGGIIQTADMVAANTGIAVFLDASIFFKFN